MKEAFNYKYFTNWVGEVMSLLKSYLHYLEKDHLVQCVDLNLDLNQVNKTEILHLKGYFEYNIKEAINFINIIIGQNISSVVLRITSKKKIYPLEKIDIGIKAIREIEKNIISSINIIIDPFGLALQENGQWGIFKKNGFISVEKTHSLIYKFVDTHQKILVSDLLEMDLWALMDI